MLFSGGAHELVALRVGDDLRGVERLLEVVEQRGLVALEFRGGAVQNLGGFDALVLERREATCKYRFADERERLAEIERSDCRPFTRSLLSGGVKNLVNDRLAVVALIAKNIAGDFDEVGVEHAFVPVGQSLVHLLVGHAEAFLHYLVGFADHLHVAILDAIVHHLDEMTRAVFADPLAAGFAGFGVGGYFLKDGFHGVPSLGRTAGHDGRAEQRAFLATGDAGADVEQTFAFDIFSAADRVGIVAVATVDNDVAFFEVGDDLFDERVHRGAGLHEHHYLARAFEVGAQLFDAVASDKVFVFSSAFHKGVDFRHRAVEHRYREALTFHVENEVFAHHGQSNQTNICFHIPFPFI